MNRQTRKKQRDQKREAIGILLMAFALLIFLGLVSYHQTDYPNSGSPDAVRNWLGLAGSWISYYLYVYTIGYACLIFPLLLFMLGWTIFFRRDFRNLFRMSLYILALGVFLSTTLGMPERYQKREASMGSGSAGCWAVSSRNSWPGTWVRREASWCCSPSSSSFSSRPRRGACVMPCSNSGRASSHSPAVS